MRPVKSYGSFKKNIRKSPINRPDSADSADNVVTELIAREKKYTIMSRNKDGGSQQLHLGMFVPCAPAVAPAVAPTISVSAPTFIPAKRSTNATIVHAQTRRDAGESDPTVQSQSESKPFKIPMLVDYDESAKHVAVSSFNTAFDINFKPIPTPNSHPGPTNIILVDLDQTIYLEYELDRAFSEMRLSHPFARNDLYIIKFGIVHTHKNMTLSVVTPERNCTAILGNTYEISTVLKLLHREIQRSPIITYARIYGCSSSCNYMKIHNSVCYSNMVCCESVEHMISMCFGISYCGSIFRESYRDTVIENIANFIVVWAPQYDYFFDPCLKNFLTVKFPSVSIVSVLRDPRFEFITKLRFDPWLGMFEILRDNGKCVALFNKRQCGNKKLAGVNYCEEHKCRYCTITCRHVGGMT